MLYLVRKLIKRDKKIIRILDLELFFKIKMSDSNLINIRIIDNLLDIDYKIFKMNPDNYSDGMTMDLVYRFSFLPEVERDR